MFVDLTTLTNLIHIKRLERLSLILDWTMSYRVGRCRFSLQSMLTSGPALGEHNKHIGQNKDNADEHPSIEKKFASTFCAANGGRAIARIAPVSMYRRRVRTKYDLAGCL